MKRIWKQNNHKALLRTRIRIPETKPRGEKRIQTIFYSLSKSLGVYSSSPAWVTIEWLHRTVSSAIEMCSLVELCLENQHFTPEAQQMQVLWPWSLCTSSTVPMGVQLNKAMPLLLRLLWKGLYFLSGLVDGMSVGGSISLPSCSYIQFSSLELFPTF